MNIELGKLFLFWYIIFSVLHLKCFNIKIYKTWIYVEQSDFIYIIEHEIFIFIFHICVLCSTLLFINFGDICCSNKYQMLDSRKCRHYFLNVVWKSYLLLFISFIVTFLFCFTSTALRYRYKFWKLQSKHDYCFICLLPMNKILKLKMLSKTWIKTWQQRLFWNFSFMRFSKKLWR